MTETSPPAPRPRPRRTWQEGVVQAAAETRKFTTAVLGLVALAITTGAVHGTAENWCQTIITAATALGVYAVPNRPQR